MAFDPAPPEAEVVALRAELEEARQESDRRARWHADTVKERDGARDAHQRLECRWVETSAERDRLAAEVERLRGALQKVADGLDYAEVATFDENGSALTLDAFEVRKAEDIARAALTRTPEGTAYDREQAAYVAGTGVAVSKMAEQVRALRAELAARDRRIAELEGALGRIDAVGVAVDLGAFSSLAAIRDIASAALSRAAAPVPHVWREGVCPEDCVQPAPPATAPEALARSQARLQSMIDAKKREPAIPVPSAPVEAPCARFVSCGVVVDTDPPFHRCKTCGRDVSAHAPVEAAGPVVCAACIVPHERVRGCRYGRDAEACSRCGNPTTGRVVVDPAEAAAIERPLVTDADAWTDAGRPEERHAVEAAARRPGVGDVVEVLDRGVWETASVVARGEHGFTAEAPAVATRCYIGFSAVHAWRFPTPAAPKEGT